MVLFNVSMDIFYGENAIIHVVGNSIIQDKRVRWGKSPCKR